MLFFKYINNREAIIPLALVSILFLSNMLPIYSGVFSLFFIVVIPILFLFFNSHIKIKLNYFIVTIIFLFFWSLCVVFRAGEYIETSIIRLFLVYIPIFLIIISLSQFDDLKKVFDKFAFLFVLYSSLLTISSIILIYFGTMGFDGKNSIQSLNIGPLKFSQIVMGSLPFPRVSSLTPNPNTFAGINVIAISLIFYIYRNKNINLFLFLFLTLLTFLGVVLTLSRAGIFAAIISLLGMFFFNGGIFKVTLKVLCTFVILTLFYFLVNLNNILIRSDDGLSDRDVAWNALIESIYEKPFMGVGFGISPERILYNLNDISSGHSSYLIIASEIGIIGLFIFVLLWLSIFYKCLIIYKNNILYRNIVSCVFVINLSWIILQAFEGQFLRVHIVNYMFFFLGSLVFLLKVSKK